MKILVINLLRAGDVIMSTAAISGLKRRYKNAKVHLLINQQFSGLEPILENVEKTFYFNRNEMQFGLGEYDRPVFESLDRLNKLLEKINFEDYDLVINLTQNKLSGKLASLIQAKEKKGLVINDIGAPFFGSPWFSYLNDDRISSLGDIFHMIDIYYYGSDLPYYDHGIKLKETTKGLTEANKIIPQDEPYICVQISTSDKKKNFGKGRFARALKVVNVLHPEYKILVLGAPGEETELNEFVLTCRKLGFDPIVAICSFEGALSLLNSSKMLLTGDTSIKHLACATDTKIVELCIGSSDYIKTGAYKPGSYILKTEEACSPCKHSEDCPKSSHLCAERVDPEAVGVVVSKVISGNLTELEIVAQEYKDQFSLFKTYFSHSGFWQFRNLAQSFTERDLEYLLEVSSCKLLNRNEHKKLIGEYGSEGVKIRAAIQQVYPFVASGELEGAIENLEARIQDCVGKLVSLSSKLSMRPSEVISEHISGESVYMSNLNRVLEKYTNSNEDRAGVKDFSKIRQIRKIIQDELDKNQISVKLLRTLKNNSMENL